MSEITLYGHRGGGDPYPDSTVESYSWGANWGADSLEPDLYLTKDGVLVVSHDDELLSRLAVDRWLELDEDGLRER